MTGVLEAAKGDLRVVELSGSEREIGYQHGLLFKQPVARMLREQFYDPYKKVGVSDEQLVNFAKKHMPYIEEYSPESMEKIRGIAEGAGFPVEEIVLVNMHEERALGRLSRQISPLYEMHCTALGAAGPATADGETYIGQNWDFPAELYWDGEASFLQHEKRSSGTNVLSYNAPGFLAWAGMNSSGIGLSWTSVPRAGLQVGMPTYVIVNELLHSRSIGKAIAGVVRAKRAGCFNFVMADENGEVYDVEATPDEVGVSYCNGTMAHTNHFIKLHIDQDKHFREWLETGDGARPNLNTIVRQNRMEKLLTQSFGKVSLELCESFLRDHVNYPQSICVHEGDKYKGITFESWVMVPRKKEWWIARHPICKNQYRKYVVN